MQCAINDINSYDVLAEKLTECAASVTRLAEVTQAPPPLLKHINLSPQPTLLSQVRGLRSGPGGWVGSRAGVRTAAVTQEVVEDSEEAGKQLSKGWFYYHPKFYMAYFYLPK